MKERSSSASASLSLESSANSSVTPSGSSQMAAFMFSVSKDPLSDISSVPLLINLHTPGLIKIFDFHQTINQKTKASRVNAPRCPSSIIPKNPVLKVFDLLQPFFHRSWVNFFDVKTHSTAFIKVFDFRWAGWRRDKGRGSSWFNNLNETYSLIKKHSLN